MPDIDLATVAKEEGVSPDVLRASIDGGRVVIMRNRRRTGGKPLAVGAGLRTKVNANIGTSDTFPDVDEELNKLAVAVDAGTDAVMDLSTAGDLDRIRREILSRSPVAVGTVPIYQAALEAIDRGAGIVAMTGDDMFRVIEKHAHDGVDFVTVHCGVTKRVIEALKASRRVADIVSRGGAFLTGWIIHNNEENPLYAEFDRLLELALRYDLTLSLGDGLRPGALADATDRPQLAELSVLGELVQRARRRGVKAIVEGPGHVPLNQIEANVRLEKEICRGAPFYVLGPIVTDVAPGYDEITAAIGGALAAFYGADFLCYVTPREHLGLPTADDVRRGVVASRIAAHAADVAKGVPGAGAWDLEMSRARKSLDWTGQIGLAIDPTRAKHAHQERRVREEDGCTMCGKFCAMKLVADYLGTGVEKC